MPSPTVGVSIRMTPSVGLAAPAFPILTASTDAASPAVASIIREDGTGQFLVACDAYYSPISQAFIEGQLVSETGTLEGGRLYISPGPGLVAVVAGNNTSREYLVAWFDPAPATGARTVWPAGILGPLQTRLVPSRSIPRL